MDVKLQAASFFEQFDKGALYYSSFPSLIFIAQDLRLLPQEVPDQDPQADNKNEIISASKRLLLAKDKLRCDEKRYSFHLCTFKTLLTMLGCIFCKT